jgi:ribosomal protein L3 glutamine methyltransferase
MQTSGHVPAEAIETFSTIRDWLRFATGAFTAANLAYGHGTAAALDEAAFLILEALRLPVDDINPWLDAHLVPAERQRIAGLIEARITRRVPAPYLVGAAYIQGRRFIVDPSVIVPRSYIGELIVSTRLVDALDDIENIGRVLEVCTGSGCLAILAAEAFPEAKIDAVDISAAALKVAAANVAAHGVGDRIELLAGDLFGPVAGRQYDLIIANPPYVATAEMAAFPPEHRAEPAIAHAGGADGLDIVRRILLQAADHLLPGGTLIMEVGTGRWLIEDEFPDAEFFWLDTAESDGEVLAIGAEDLADLIPDQPVKPAIPAIKGRKAI